jgi:hypothetical protein
MDNVQKNTITDYNAPSSEPFTLHLVLANARHVWLYECAVRAMRKKSKLSSNGGDSGSKKCKQGYGEAYGGVWRSLRLAGV